VRFHSTCPNRCSFRIVIAIFDDCRLPDWRAGPQSQDLAENLEDQSRRRRPRHLCGGHRKSQAQSQCPCKSGDSLTLDDAAWMPYDDPYCGQLSADGWSVSSGTATFDSTESELDGYYNTSGGISQIICVPTPGYRIHCHISGSSQAGNPLVWCAGPGFGFYFNQWGGISEDGFDSEADLSVGSNEIAFKLCGSPFAEGPIHVEINFEIIAPSV